MATERRASRRARARTALPPGSHARRPLLLTLALATAGALGGCRQTVILDPSVNGDGGARTGAAGTGGSILDAGFDFGGTGGIRFDAGRLEVLGNFCPSGPIQVLQVVPRKPDVIISVDRSAAMQAWWGAQSRLEAVQQQVHALVPQYERAMRFGYQEFPSTSGMCGNGQGCCAGSVIPPLQRNRNAIDNAQHACDSGGQGCAQAQRPAADALARINKAYASFNAMNKGHRYVILVLGGDPTCGDPGGGDPAVAACEASVMEVQKLNAAGIFTTVVGVGDEAATAQCLQDLTVAGGIGTSVILAKTPSALSDSLTTTVTKMAQEACDLDVLTPPADTKNVSLLFDGELVPNNAADGWDFDPNTSLKITVRGRWCDTLLHTQTIDFISGCVPPRH